MVIAPPTGLCCGAWGDSKGNHGMGIIDLHTDTSWPPLAPPMPAPEGVASGKPEQQALVLFSAPGDGLTLGRWSGSPRAATSGPWPVDDFILLRHGSATIRLTDGRTETLQAGDAFFIPRGLDCTWDPAEPASGISLSFADGIAIPGAGLPLRVDPQGALAASEGPSPALLIGPAPQQQARDWHEDASGRFSVGVWATTPYVRRPIPYPRHELMHLIEGEVTLTADGAAPRTYREGESFFVPKGCVVDWVSTVPVRKVFCSVLPPL